MIVFAIIIVPKLFTADIVPHRKGHLPALEPGQQTIQPDGETEAIKCSTYQRFLVSGRDFARGLPVIKGEPNSHPFFKGQVFDRDATEDRLLIVREDERGEDDLGILFDDQRHVGERESHLGLIAVGSVNEGRKIRIGATSIVGGTSITRNGQGFLFCQKEFDVLELGVKFDILDMGRSGRFALSGGSKGQDGQARSRSRLGRFERRLEGLTRLFEYLWGRDGNGLGTCVGRTSCGRDVDSRGGHAPSGSRRCARGIIVSRIGIGANKWRISD